MIDELDEALRQLFIRELPIKNNEVDVAFDQPKREWSARLSRPTVNIFLHDVRENVRLRQAQLQRQVERTQEGVGIQRRNYVRLDLQYLITVWATEPEDEHRLLARALMVLFRHQEMPADLIPEGLKAQPEPIPISVAQYDTVEKPSDIWNVLDNQQRPAIMMVTTLALDPHEAITAPLVRARELRFGQAADPSASQHLLPHARSNGYWTVGGTVRSKTPLKNVNITVIESGQTVNLQSEGRFAIGNLRSGDYTLEIAVENRRPSQYKITVPSPDYDINL